MQVAEVEDRGLRYDRRWMLVDAQGKFLTQRQHAQMALLQVSLQQEGLLVRHRQETITPLSIPFEASAPSQDKVEVRVWDDTVLAEEVSAEANAWFTEALGMHARLVRMPEQSLRQVDPRYATQGEIVSFADGYPFLIIGQASLDDLNSRLERPVPMDRFRPNFVFRGGVPFEEDTWVDFTIGGQPFKGVKPCARCILTTVDQETAVKSPEPLRTLATYRQQNNKVMFGQNLLHSATGTLRVGDAVEVLSRK